MSAHIKWDAWWAIFKNLEDDQKVMTFNENFQGLNGWSSFVQRQTPKNQLDILKEAPKPLIRTLKPVLYPEVQVKLLGKPRSNGRRLR